MSASLGESLAFVAAAALAHYLLASRWPRWTGLSAAATTSAVLGALLVQYWVAERSDSSTVGGVIPFSDAAGYYADAQRLLAGGTYSDFSCRRPLYPGFLTALLWLTGLDLKWALVLAAAMGVLALAALVDEGRRWIGALGSAVLLFLSLTFIRRFAVTTLTESLGYPLGCLGLALALRAERTRSAALGLAALAVFSFGQSARAGAMFVVPFLALRYGWDAYRTRQGGARLLAIALIPVAAGVSFAIQGAYVRAGCAGTAVPFANFAHTLYGQVAGGVGWKHVLVEHPELEHMAPREATARMLELSAEMFRAHPHRLVVGILRSYVDFVLPIGRGAFGYVVRGPLTTVNVAVSVLTCVLAMGAFAWGVARVARGDVPHGGWRGLGVLLAAVAVSIPFVPPIDADHMRALAVTVPVTAFVAALGAEGLARRIGFMSATVDERGGDGGATLALTLAGVLAALACLGLALRFVLPRNLVPTAEGAASRCEPGTREVEARLGPASAAAVSASFFQWIGDSDAPEVFSPLRSEMGRALQLTVDARTMDSMWLVTSPAEPPGERCFCVVPRPTDLEAVTFFMARGRCSGD